MKQTVSHTTYRTSKSVFERKGAANSELKKSLVDCGIMEEESVVSTDMGSNARSKASAGESPAPPSRKDTFSSPFIAYGEFLAYNVSVTGDVKICQPMIALVPPGSAVETASSISGGTGHTSQDVLYSDLRRADMKRLPSRVNEMGTVDGDLNDDTSIFTSASGTGFGDAGGWVFKYLPGGKWLRRFLVIRGDFLYLFTSPVSEKPLEIVCLWYGATVIIPQGSGRTFDQRPSSRTAESGFEFKVSGGVNVSPVRLYAETSEARTMWRETIEERILSSRSRVEGAGVGVVHPASPNNPLGADGAVTGGHVVTTTRLLPAKTKPVQVSTPAPSGARAAGGRPPPRGPPPPPPPASVSANKTPQAELEAAAVAAPPPPVIPAAASVASALTSAASQASKENMSLPTPPPSGPPQVSGAVPVAQTMVSAQSQAGAVQVTVQHAMGFAAGMPVTISPGLVLPSGSEASPPHNNTVVGVNFNVIDLAAPLPHAINMGSIVLGFANQAMAAGAGEASATISANESASSKATTDGTALASKLKPAANIEEGSEESKESVVSDRHQRKASSKEGGGERAVGQVSPEPEPEPEPEPSHKPALVPIPPMESSSRSIGASVLTAEARDNEDDVVEQKRGLAAIADSNIHEMLKADTHPHKVFDRAMLRRLNRENEARRREESVYTDMENVELILEHQRTENVAKSGPMSMSKLLRTVLFFKGYSMVVDPTPEVVSVTSNSTPLINGEFAENAIVSVYRQYTNESGFMSVEELVRFFADSGIVNTHCPHTPFDEPVIEVAEQLDPVRMLVTMPIADTLGVNNPQENAASRELQEALKDDPFTINFSQFYSILQKVSRVVYPQLYEMDPTLALNKVLLESLLPLYSWTVDNDKRGTQDPLLQDERIALLIVTYMPNLWKVFLAYACDSFHKSPEIDLPFPQYAQACEHSLFGRPRGAPYEAPGSELSHEVSAVADLDEDENELRLMQSGSTIHSKSRYIEIPGGKSTGSKASGKGYSSSKKKALSETTARSQGIVLSEGRNGKKMPDFKPGTVASKREIYRRYSFRTDMAAGRVMNQSEAGGLRHTHRGLSKDAVHASQNQNLASDRGADAINAATMKAKVAGLTAAQVEEQKAAMFGLFVGEKKALQFCHDYGLVNHLLPRQRIIALVKDLNKAKKITLGHKTTTMSKRTDESSVVASQTMAQKLKSKRMSVLQSLDKSYLSNSARMKRGGATMGGKSQHELYDDDLHRDTFKINPNAGISAADRARRKKVMSANTSSLSEHSGLSFSEFMEFLCLIALEGMSTEQYHKMFDTPFKKIQALLTVWGVADIKKLEEVLQLHVDIVI